MSLEEQLERANRKGQEYRRRTLVYELDKHGIDPASKEGLNVIDNYLPRYDHPDRTVFDGFDKWENIAEFMTTSQAEELHGRGD